MNNLESHSLPDSDSEKAGVSTDLRGISEIGKEFCLWYQEIMLRVKTRKYEYEAEAFENIFCWESSLLVETHHRN